jgi:hypothetical protein
MMFQKRLRRMSALVFVIAAFGFTFNRIAEAQAISTATTFGQDVLTCSPSPCVLPPSQASEGGGEVTNTPIASDPLDPMRLLLGSNDVNCPPPSISGFHFSSDGGSTWTRTCMPVVTGPNRVYWPGGQPMVAYDMNGNAYIASEYEDSEGIGYGLVVVQQGDGVSWNQPEFALGGVIKLFLYSWLAIDTSPVSPYANNLYVSAVALDEPYQDKSRVVVSHSSDGGKTWKATAVDPPQTYPTEDDFTNLTVGRDGTVYVTWQHCVNHCADATAYMLFSKSSDGGNTWSRPVLMAKITIGNSACDCDSGDLPNTDDVRVYDYPVIGADNSTGPYSGNLYVTMYSWAGTYMRVQVIRSTDGGRTWSKPVYLAPASDTHDQFFPWLSVSSTGLLGVSWLDRRNDPDNVNYQPFAAISRDGGQSFQPNVQLTTAFSNPNNNGSGWMGDFSGNTWVGSSFVAAWMDSSNGVDMQEVVGGVKLH